MAGHSKWANTKHRKAAQDKKKSKVFTRLIREIVVSASQGGGDPDSNPRLRAAIDAALSANMTKDTVMRAVKRGAGGEEGKNLDEIIYEGYGPNGVAVMVLCMTDNRNRTVSGVRHAFTKTGGNLGTDGSVSYLFVQKGLLLYPAEVEEDALMEAALEVGADDIVTSDDGCIEVQTTPEDFLTVKAALKERGFVPESGEVTQIASTQVELDRDQAEKMLRLLDMLEELDDVQNVYSNADISDEIMEALGN